MKKILLGLGASLLTFVPAIAVISCSSTTKPSTSLTEKEFKVEQKIAGKNRVNDKEKVLDPTFNMNAVEIVNRLFDSLTVSQLQRDFDLILTDFYEIFEFENSSVEIELEKIVVKSIGSDKRTVKLEVTYESETETRDGETLVTKEIDWKIKPTVSSQAQIEQIKQMINGATSSNTGIDIEELKEYFLGENDDDMDFDDFGVFDRVAKLNNDKELNNLGGLVGYELKLSDIFSELIPFEQRNITLDTTFFAPSSALNNTFIYPSETGTLNYELDLTVLATITEAELLNFKTANELGSIIEKSDDNTEKLELVSGIEIERLANLFKVTVNFKESNKLSEVISINPSLLKK
ncbi:MAG: hypothetical protein ACRC1F_02400 [Metamycoplasmataceae bacterium]